jgi:hypothetical protein
MCLELSQIEVLMFDGRWTRTDLLIHDLKTKRGASQ